MESLNIGYGRSKDKALTPSERKKIEQSITDIRDKTLFYLMCYGGLRVNEVEQVRFEWLELREINGKEVLVIKIPNEAKNIKNPRKIWRPKTRVGREVFIFYSKAINEIYYYFKMANFIDISIRQIRNIVYRWGGLIDKDISPHALRATCQNYWKYELDLKIEVISYMLGHSSVRTTLEFYDTRGEAQVESYFVNKAKDLENS